MAKTSKRRIHGEGSIFQVTSGPKAGQWVGQITLGYQEGRRKIKSFFGPTEKAVVTKIQAYRVEAAQGITDGDSKLTEWIEYWLAEICPQRIGVKTLYNYTRLMRLHVEPVIGSMKLKSLTPDSIRTVHKRMRDQGLAESTVRTTHVILSCCLKVAEREGKVRRNVAAQTDAPSSAAHPMDVLTTEDARRIIAGAKDKRELARLVCALVLGMRQGEVLALKWDDVDFAKGTLRVDESVGRVPGSGFVTKNPKTKSGKRVIPLPDPVAAILRMWHAQPDRLQSGYVFPGLTGGPEGPERDRKVWVRARDRVGAPPVKLHGARGTSASLLLEMGVPERVIADILGHANVRVTMQHYLHSSEDQRENALDGLADRLGIAPIGG